MSSITLSAARPFCEHHATYNINTVATGGHHEVCTSTILVPPAAHPDVSVKYCTLLYKKLPLAQQEQE